MGLPEYVWNEPLGSLRSDNFSDSGDRVTKVVNNTIDIADVNAHANSIKIAAVLK